MAEIFADLLDRSQGPALSATSDMPVVTPPAEAAVEAEGADAPKPAAEGDTPAAETPAAEDEEGEAGADGEGEADGEGAESVSADGEQQPAAPTKRPPGIARRIGELTTARRAAEAERDALKERAEAAERALQEAIARIPKADEPKPEAPPRRPMREEFDTPEAYDEALLTYGRAIERIELQEHNRAQQEEVARNTNQNQAQTRVQQVFDTYKQRETAFVAEHPDFTAKVLENDSLPISEPMRDAILESDLGPAAAYYLAEHPDVAAKIAGIVVPGMFYPLGHPYAGRPVPHVQRQMLEMGRIFATLEAESKPAAETPKPAPPPPAPISPVRGRGATAVQRTLQDVGNEGSMEEYAAQRLPVLQSERRASGIFGGRS